MPSEKTPLDPITNSPKGEPFNVSGHIYDIGGMQDTFGSFNKEYISDKNFRKFIDNLSGDEKILDLGSGLGSGLVRFLKRQKKLNNLVSVDLDFENLKTQKTVKKENHLLIQADAKILPISSNSIDILVVSGLFADNELNRTNKIKLINSEISRILKVGGYLVWTEDKSIKPSSNDFELVFRTSVLEFYKRKSTN